MDNASYGSSESNEHARISLSETLDRVLNKGVVVCGEVVISVADIDLVYLGLQLVLTSVDTAERMFAHKDRQEPCTARSEQ
jgi:hypothetical protein